MCEYVYTCVHVHTHVQVCMYIYKYSIVACRYIRACMYKPGHISYVVPFVQTGFAFEPGFLRNDASRRPPQHASLGAVDLCQASLFYFQAVLQSSEPLQGQHVCQSQLVPPDSLLLLRRCENILRDLPQRQTIFCSSCTEPTIIR